MDLQPVDFASSLQAGQNLVPNYLDQQVKQSLLAAQRSETAKDDQAISEQQQYADDVKRYFGTNPEPGGIEYMTARYPKAWESMKLLHQSQDRVAAQSDMTTLGSIWSATGGALRASDPAKRAKLIGLAREAARRRVESDQASGHATEEDQHVLDMLNSEDPDLWEMTYAGVGHFIAARAPDNYSAALKALGGEAREDQLQPGKVREQEAAATTKEAEADSAGEYYPAHARREQAQASTESAEAATASDYYQGRAREQTYRADIAATDSAWRAADNAAGVGLKQAQVTAVRAQIVKTATETGKLRNDVTVGDVMTPIWQKVAAGTALSPGEAAAFAAYSNAPASQRLTNQPARGAPRRGGNRPAPVIGHGNLSGLRRQITGKIVGGVAVSPNEPIAQLGNGKPAVVRGGRWVEVN
jgi:hypothetical protein